MKVLFVYSLDDVQSRKAPLRTQEQIQFGISYISSFLKKHGHTVELVVLSRAYKDAYKASLDSAVKRFSPRLICYSAVSSEYSFMAGVAQYVKSAYPKLYQVIGGCHVTLNPDYILADGFDAVCIGEGEAPTLELVAQLDAGMSPSGIPGFWFNRPKGIEKNPPRPFLQNLDELPFPDRKIWLPWIQEQLGAGISILLGRGCPFECTYCCNSALKKISEGAYVRFRSPRNIVEELETIAAEYPDKKTVYFEVESFAINFSWALELCRELEQFNKNFKEPFSFGVNLRVAANIDYKSLFAALQRAHFTFINIGLESGSERVRREVLNRFYSNEDILSVVRLAREHGLKVTIFNIIGFPGETEADFKETVRMNRECLPDKHFTGIFYPYPGTKLYALCQEQGLLKNGIDPQRERRRAVFDLPGFSKKQIERSYQLFDYYVYKGIKPLPEIAARVIAVMLQSNPGWNILYRKVVRLPLLKNIRRMLARR